jgi:hypothetical protein
MPGEGPSGAPDAPDGSSASLELLIHHQSPEVLHAVAADTRLTEELALALISRRDLPADVLEALARNRAVMRSRRVAIAVFCHPHTPRHISLPGTRHLYTFELMQIALAPAVPADLKMVAEDALMNRLETLPSGERLSLARRASTRVAAALLLDTEQRVINAALDNPHLTEFWVVGALQKPAATEAFVHAVCRHPKWSLRRDVQSALLRNEHTPLPRAVYFAKSLPTSVLRDVVTHAPIAATVKIELLREILEREAKSASAGT